MKHRLLILASLTLSLATLLTAAARAQAAVDLTGKWLFTVQTSAGGGAPTVTLKQEGQKLSGHYASDQLGEAELTGAVDGGAFTFKFAVDVQGTHLDVTYTGTIEGKDSVKGTLNLGGLGEGTFTGKRQS